MLPLDAFVAAQHDTWDDALREIAAGRKTTHWIWWIFPQLAVLGRSDRARLFGLDGADDAARYLAHPVLGPRLVTITDTLLQHCGRDAVDILGEVDALKLRSCMTLFEAVPDAPPCFAQTLDTFHGGTRCAITHAAVTEK